MTGTLVCSRCATPHARGVYIFGVRWLPGSPCSERNCSGTLRLTGRQNAEPRPRIPIRRPCADCGRWGAELVGQLCEQCR